MNKITVLMSVYNGQKWIENSIVSVLNQSFADFEFIIVDDGSTDNSINIIKEFADTDSRIRIISKHNTGLPDSLNYGIKEANGSWIARIDADDLCEPYRLEKQYSLALSNSSLVLLGCNAYTIDASASVIKSHCYPQNHRKLLRNLRSCKKFFPHSSAFFKTEVARLLGGYRVQFKYAQDHDLWLRMSELGQIGCANIPLVKIRLHDAQRSNDNDGKCALVYAYMARTSYYLRQCGEKDPASAHDDDGYFNYFNSWMTKQINRAKIHEQFLLVSEIKKLVKSGNSNQLATFFISIIFKNPFLILALLKKRALDDFFPKKLANRWKNDIERNL